LFLKEIAQHLGETTEAVQNRLCILRDGSVLPEPSDGFKVWNRYKHVVTEAQRVDSAVGAFAAGDSFAVGELMNQSHASCRDDYEVSCPELEALVSMSREHGALGARLTGAGFGGCTVNAVPSHEVTRFIDGVTAAYYHGYVRQEKERPFTNYTNLQDVIFVCRATTGAGAWPNKGAR
jgi:galactokinase